ncbi:hypothetical protein GRX03_01905 [Halovenus sp. WSH3]|uniref:Uncharacterized protein n=1 Tax=Halovenus carboxidivorans TaxID=2692199 RepID=A0A6B0T4Y5_9EURY|nr:hypothetical protein [Halovenus carboxidivorans]MXR50362.1 hypothetical protein [Halovenus carboxidivorans]
MDRITALRTIEDALTAYEQDELALPELEREVRGILRTYASEFDEETATYRASGDPSADGLVVIASSPTDARERIEGLLPDPETTRFEVERVE